MVRRAGLALAVLAACAAEEPGPGAASSPVAAASVEARPDVVGTWRAVLTTAGGELPFGLVIRTREASGTEGALAAVIVNGPERIEPSRVAWEGRELVIGFDVYDSEIRAEVDADVLTGRWIHTMPGGPETMTFSARRGEAPRFVGAVDVPVHPVPTSIDGDWSAVFTTADGSTFAAQGVLASAGTDGAIEATFLTDTGDFRWLDGRYERGRLELSCFDGAHAFLLRADVDEGGTLRGEFWAMGGMHATWRATRMADGDAGPLADPSTVVALSPAANDGRFEFAFPDLQGRIVTCDDPRFVGKVVLVDVFGTWCPNCNDQAPLLAEWDRRYGPRGLEIVGLAFEMTGDRERDRTFVRRYAERHGIEFPLLLAGTSDKAQAAAALPTLTRIVAYPTTILVGRDGKVRRIHSGFAGPATGEHHTALVAAMEREIEGLLGGAGAG
jgi:thiol-disulfide isomerase/thioredoxin